MAKRLTNLRLEELSLVDEGSNEGADVVIIKRKDPEIDPATGKPKKKPGSTLGTPSNPATLTGDPATSSFSAAAAGDAVSKLRMAMLQHLPDFATELVAKALAASPAADPDAAATAAASITEMFMDLAQLSAALEKAEGDNAELKALVAKAKKDLEAANETITKMKTELDTANETITKSKGGASLTPEQEDEAFLKSLPAGARDRILAERKTAAENAELVQKMAQKQDETEAIAKARNLGAPEPEKTGPLLVRIQKGKTTPEDAALLETLFKATGEQLKEVGFYKSAGIVLPRAAVDDPEAQLQAHADEIRKAKPKLTAAQAYEEAMQQYPELYNDYVAKRRT